MKQQLAPDLYILTGFPHYTVNTYLMGNILVDAGIRYDARRLIADLTGHSVIAHALTHAHPDHQGASKAICETFKIPFWCSAPDRLAAETGQLCAQGVIPNNLIARLENQFLAGPGHPVTRLLHEGDRLGGFEVIATPGHSPGHLSFWRETDRVLIVGDTVRNISFATLRQMLGLPPDMFTVNPAQNRDSARKLAALKPNLICFGHGRPLTDGQKFVDYIKRLPL